MPLLDLFKKRYLLLKVLLVVLAMLLLLLIGFYLGLKQESKISDSGFGLNKNKPVLPCLETKSEDNNVANGDYEDEYVFFDKLQGWVVSPKQNDQSILSYVVLSENEFVEPQIDLDIMIQNWETPRGVISTMSDEEVIEENKAWRASSRSDIGGLQPEQIEKSFVTVDGKSAIRYVFRLNGEGKEFEGRTKPLVVWYMLHHQNKLVWLSFNDTEQEIIDQFIQGFKIKNNFTDY